MSQLHGFVSAGPTRLAHPRRRQDFALPMALLLAAAFATVVQMGLALRGVAPVLEGSLLDTDDYMRLVRVDHLWRSGAWFDAVIPRIDPPLGLALHWTRPMDLLLLVGAWAASPLVGFQSGLFWWGVVANPLLLLVSLGAVVWAARPVLARNWLPLVAFLFVVQPGVLARFMIGRPDHHGLLILLAIVAIGFAARIVQNPQRRGLTRWAGLIGALAVWVSVESIVIVAMSVAAAGLYWILGDRRQARALGDYGVGLAGGLALALLIERGPGGMGAVEIDKISLLHVIAAVVNAAAWCAIAAADRRRAIAGGLLVRVLSLAAMAAAGFLLMYGLFPQSFADPMGNGGDLYLHRHLAHVKEVQPLLSLGALQGERWASALGRAILWLGIAVPALPWLAYRLRAVRRDDQRPWLVLALAAAAYVPLTLYQVRWASYAEAVLILPYADMAAALAVWLSQRLSALALACARPLLFFLLFVWIYMPGIVAESNENAANSTSVQQKKCPIKDLAETLNDPAGLGDGAKRVLAFIDFGPEILYRTPHSVLSIPNHRFQPGFTASYRIMTATDFTVARELLAERRVHLIAICPDSAESWFYEADEANLTLFQALKAGTPPAFLVAVPLPVEAGDFRLFAVRPHP